jgi:putative sigma-54 modulation protein
MQQQQLTITGTNIDLSQEMRAHIDHKLGKISRILATPIMDFSVVFREEKTKDPQNRFVAQLTLDSNGTMLRAEERGDSLLTVVDKLEQTMMRRIEHYKGKLAGRGRGKPSALRTGFQEPAPLEEGASETAPTIVRVKHFTIKPMPEDEAVEQMELLGHDFFIFVNQKTGSVNVVYKRNDGNYGLIEPEYR